MSYLCIRYLSETMSPDAFKSLMPDFNQIKNIGNTVVSDMLEYYDKKYMDKKSK